MPELPDVETVRRAVERSLKGRRITSASIRDDRLAVDHAGSTIERHLRGRRVERVRRRGKYILLDLDDGWSAMHHLRMTGVLETGPADDQDHGIPGGHVHDRAYEQDRARATYSADGVCVWFVDRRRLGTLQIGHTDELDSWLDDKLGPEPSSPAFNVEHLQQALRRRSGTIKAALLDQLVAAGIGNVYADEALFRARIDPEATARELDRAVLRRLRDAIRTTVRDATKVQSSALRPTRTVSEALRRIEGHLQVQGREGEPCRRCDGTVHKATIAGRPTYWCPRCQRRG